MIEVDHLSKRYGSQLAVDDISFRCEPAVPPESELGVLGSSDEDT